MALENTAPHDSPTRFVDGLLELVRIMGTMITPNPDAGFAKMSAENYPHGNQTQADDLLEEIIIRLPMIGGGGGGGPAYWGSILGSIVNQTDLMNEFAKYQKLIEKNTKNGYVGLNDWDIQFRNLLNTYTSVIRNQATAARVYEFPDKNIKVAGITDVITEVTLGFAQVNFADNTTYYFGKGYEYAPISSFQNYFLFRFPFDGVITKAHLTKRTPSPASSENIPMFLFRPGVSSFDYEILISKWNTSNPQTNIYSPGLPVNDTDNYGIGFNVPNLATNGSGFHARLTLTVQRT